MKRIVIVGLLSLCSVSSSPAQKLVDPAAVAPEYRGAAENRRAEQIKQRECAHKAEVEKITRRDRTGYLIHCLEAGEAK